MVDTTVAPYYDDYDEDNQFHRILFRPGRAVQARELTQLQTILQNQITRFGQNIFLDGSVVIPGSASVDTGYEFVKITAAEFGAIVVGASIVGNDTGLVAQVVQLVAAENSDPATIYVRYTGGGSGDGGRFNDAETITWTNPVEIGGSGSFTVDTNGTGTGTKIDLNKGIYFVRGFFAAATSQSLIIEKYGVPSGVQEVGLVVAESIVTSETDTTLLDNANGTNNRNAPGADRLKYTLSLSKRADVLDTSGNFESDYFTIATLKDALIVKQLDSSQYAAIGDEMARRTFDESGNYTVDPFIASLDEHPSDNTKLRLNLDPGRAYVKGYLVDKVLASYVDIDKALTTQTRNNSRTGTYFGNYVRVNSLSGSPEIDTFELIDLDDSGGTKRGEARVRAIELESGSIYRVYLFEVNMNSGYGFNVVRTLDGSGWSATTIDDANATTSNNAQLFDTNENSLLFPLPNARIEGITDMAARVQRQFTGTPVSGSVTLNTGSDDETFADAGSWIVIRDTDGSIVTGSASIGSIGSRTITITGLTDVAHTFYAIVDRTNNAFRVRSKTITQVTDSVITPNGDDSVDLGQFDIFELESVKDVANSDADITSRYILDNGQRDNFYGEGKLLLRAGWTAPSGNVKVTFKYLAHGVGEVFTVDSYSDVVSDPSYDYGDIPIHFFADGTGIRLSDVYDFRPKKNLSGTYDVISINELPQNNETIVGDVNFYLPRIDVVYVDSEGEFAVSKGNPSLTPQPPQIPNNAMGIYRLEVLAGTIDTQDIVSNFIENRRYTMRDIGEIEKRIERVEEWTTLSALESNTNSLEVLDANGNNRFKSGFFVDNFQNHAFADFTNSEYRASIDPIRREVRPSFVERNSRVVYKASTTNGESSSGIVIKGDFLMLDYTEVEEISQPLASSAINVNPYIVITNTGAITLSPETDEWRDVNTTTNRITINETRAVNPRLNANWDNWRWNWAGEPDIARNTNPINDASGGGIARGTFGVEPPAPNIGRREWLRTAAFLEDEPIF